MFLLAAKAVEPPPILTLSVKPQRKGEGVEKPQFSSKVLGSKEKNGNSKIRMVAFAHYPPICTLLLHVSYKNKYFSSV